MTTTRRGFFKTLFRSVATAAALAYAPSVLRMPEPEFGPGDWRWHADAKVLTVADNPLTPGQLVYLDSDGFVRPMAPDDRGAFLGVASGPFHVRLGGQIHVDTHLEADDLRDGPFSFYEVKP